MWFYFWHWMDCVCFIHGKIETCMVYKIRKTSGMVLFFKWINETLSECMCIMRLILSAVTRQKLFSYNFLFLFFLLYHHTQTFVIIFFSVLILFFFFIFFSLLNQLYDIFIMFSSFLRESFLFVFGIFLVPLLGMMFEFSLRQLLLYLFINSFPKRTYT